MFSPSRVAVAQSLSVSINQYQSAERAITLKSETARMATTPF
jgi:hypothetical protein